MARPRQLLRVSFHGSPECPQSSGETMGERGGRGGGRERQAEEGV